MWKCKLCEVEFSDDAAKAMIFIQGSTAGGNLVFANSEKRLVHDLRRPENIEEAISFLEAENRLAIRTPQQVQQSILDYRTELLNALKETNASKELIMKAERMNNDQLEVTLNNIRERARLDKFNRRDLKA